MVTLLAVDAKTFGLIKKNHLSLDKMKAELGFSGYKGLCKYHDFYRIFTNKLNLDTHNESIFHMNCSLCTSFKTKFIQSFSNF